MPIFNADGDEVRLTPEEEAMLDWKPGANDWFQNGQPNFNLVSNYSPAVLSHEGDINQRGSQWSPEEGFGPNWNSYNSPGGDLSWLSYANRQGLNQDYRQASEAQKSAYNAWVEPIIRANNKDGNGFFGGLMDFIQNGVLATPLAIPVLGGLASAAGLFGAGAGAAEGAAAGAFDFAGADALGLAQMGQAAGLSGSALADFVASGGALGSTAAGGGGIGTGALSGGGYSMPPNTPIDSFVQPNLPPASGGGILDTLGNLPPTPPGGGGGGADAVGSDWATGQATGAAGGLLPQTTGGLTAANGAGALSSGSSLISKLLSGNASPADWAQAAGTFGSTLLGVLGANNQQDALSSNADKYLALGAPYRDRLNASYQPGFSMANEPGYQDALDNTSQSILRKLSMNGNPAGNPGALIEANKAVNSALALPQLNTYRSQLGTFGQLGVNTAGTNDTAAAQSSGGVYDALGYGLNSLTQPKNNTLADLFQNYLKLNNGGIT